MARERSRDSATEIVSRSLVSGDDPQIRHPRGEQRREGDDVVLDDDVRPDPIQDCLQLGFAVVRASMRACQVGFMKVSSWSNVGLRNSDAVSRMKSFQNFPASCSPTSSSAVSVGGARSTRSSSKPNQQREVRIAQTGGRTSPRQCRSELCLSGRRDLP